MPSLSEQLLHPSTFVFDDYDFRVPVGASFAYLVGVLAFDHIAKDWQKMTLPVVSAIHNLFLSLLSLLMLVGTIVGVYYKTASQGMVEFLCSADSNAVTGWLGWSMYLYYLSKYVEFFDTVLMVLKKRPLTLLHVWHHFIICLLSYSWLYSNIIISFIGISMNTFIHVFMYSYYLLAQLMNYQPWWKIYITSAQITQFGIVFVSLVVLTATKLLGIVHNTGWFGIVSSQAVNLTFLALFINFYINEYKNKKSKPHGTPVKSD